MFVFGSFPLEDSGSAKNSVNAKVSAAMPTVISVALWRCARMSCDTLVSLRPRQNALISNCCSRRSRNLLNVSMNFFVSMLMKEFGDSSYSRSICHIWPV